MDKKEYNKKYYQEHKEKFKEYKRKFLERNPDYVKKYYKDNKEEIYKSQRKYQIKNNKKFIELCCESRRRRVEKLRANGCINAWAVVNGAEPKYKGEINE